MSMSLAKSSFRCAILSGALIFAANLLGCASRPDGTAEAKTPADRPRSGLYKEPTADERDEAARLLAAQIRLSRVMTMAYRVGGSLYLISHTACPTAAELLAANVVPDSVSTEDAWGTPFRITCGGGQITVTSAGPDQVFGTADDIVSGGP
jgi:hypothetical protein